MSSYWSRTLDAASLINVDQGSISSSELFSVVMLLCSSSELFSSRSSVVMLLLSSAWVSMELPSLLFYVRLFMHTKCIRIIVTEACAKTYFESSNITSREPPGNPNGTPRQPQGNPQATPREPPGNPEGTPRQPQRNPQATPREPPGNPEGTPREPLGNPEEPRLGSSTQKHGYTRIYIYIYIKKCLCLNLNHLSWLSCRVALHNCYITHL